MRGASVPVKETESSIFEGLPQTVGDLAGLVSTGRAEFLRREPLFLGHAKITAPFSARLHSLFLPTAVSPMLTQRAGA